jgi:hypothetical protein
MQCHGPWKSAAEYLKSIARREIDWITAYATPHEPTQHLFQYTSPIQDSPDAHIALLEKSISAIPHIVPKDHELVSPRL